jgi:hypothetical protein
LGEYYDELDNDNELEDKHNKTSWTVIGCVDWLLSGGRRGGGSKDRRTMRQKFEQMHNLKVMQHLVLACLFLFLFSLFFLLLVGCYGEGRAFVIVVCFREDYAPWR